jgi:hypothetical protein
MRAAYAPRTACLIKIDSQSKSRLSLVCEFSAPPLDLDRLVTSSENVIV